MTPEALAAIQSHHTSLTVHRSPDDWGYEDPVDFEICAACTGTVWPCDAYLLLEALRGSEADNARLLVVVGVLQDMFDLGEEVFAVSNRWPHAKALIDAALAEPSAEGGQA